MFYCDTCRKPRKWPQSLSRSNGLCEVCGKRATCHNVPSADLPLGLKCNGLRAVSPKKPEGPKKPIYMPEEAAIAAYLNARIDRGDVSAYAELTKLAAATAAAGRWMRDE